MVKQNFLRTDDYFIKFLKDNEFQHCHVDSNKEYYINSRGNQVRIDRNRGIITLLNNKGYVVDYSNTYTKKQIKQFAGRDN